MKDLGFFLGLFVLLIILSLGASSGGLLSGNKATSTPSAAPATGSAEKSTAQYEQQRTNSSTPIPTATKTTAPKPKLTPEQMERKVADIYRSLNRLSKEVRDLTLRSPISPYAGKVKLSAGTARQKDPEREYLMLSSQKSNKSPIDISDWYLVSYVTDESAAIPDGDRIIDRWRYPKESDILLLPGERAYVLTWESPIDTSFHENACTGYLAEEESFYPSLRRSCPRPLDEMKKYANIALDNDTCYDFVERIGTCKVPDEDAVESDEADLNGACRSFIFNTLNYDDCVAKHRYDPFFDDVGYWFIYLNRDEELWRYEREIIRLMDENDKVVDYIEY